MSDSGLIAGLRVDELLDRIGSGAVSPGAGAAGAVALALAAACCSKAVSVSLRHRPDDRQLLSALDTLSRIADAALVDADRDAEAFEAFVHIRGPATTEQLVSESERIKGLIDALRTAIDQVAASIRPNMIGDVIAARALLTAAKAIQERNEGEALHSR